MAELTPKLDHFYLDILSIQDRFETALAVHEFPYSNKNVIDNLGQKTRKVTVECIFQVTPPLKNQPLSGGLVLPTYEQHYEFLRWIRAGKEGQQQNTYKLTHPKYGEINGQISNVSTKHDDTQNYVEVSFEFFEIFDALYIAPAPDPVNLNADRFRGQTAKTLGIVEATRKAARNLAQWTGAITQSKANFDAYLVNVTTPASSIVNSIYVASDLPSQYVASINGAIDRVIQSYVDARNLPAQFINNLIVGIRKLKSTFSGADADYVHILGCSRAAFESAGAFQRDEENADKQATTESTDAFDVNGNPLTEPEVFVAAMTVNELERSAAEVRTFINEAIEIDRNNEDLPYQAKSIQDYVTRVNLERNRLETKEFPLMTLHEIAHRENLDYHVAERLLKLNPNVRNPTFTNGDVVITVPPAPQPPVPEGEGFYTYGGAGNHAGVVSFAGQTGVEGIQGEQGDTGVQGIIGETGATGGIQGVTGVQGQTGIQGDTGVGTQGDTGVTGVTGVQGQTGIQGDTGVGTQGDTGVDTGYWTQNAHGLYPTDTTAKPISVGRICVEPGQGMVQIEYNLEGGSLFAAYNNHEAGNCGLKMEGESGYAGYLTYSSSNKELRLWNGADTSNISILAEDGNVLLSTNWAGGVIDNQVDTTHSSDSSVSISGSLEVQQINAYQIAGGLDRSCAQFWVPAFNSTVNDLMLGIGREDSTVHAWSGNYSGLEVGGRGSIFHKTQQGSSGELIMAENMYRSGTGFSLMENGAYTTLQMGNGSLGMYRSSTGSADETLDSTSIMEWTTAGGEDRVSFNDDNADYDFEVNGLTNDSIIYADASTENVGFGVIPNANWAATLKVLEIDSPAAHNASIAVDSGMHQSVNAYNDGAWKYETTNPTQLYTSSAGSHTFYHAPSGTQDTGIDWTSSMFLAPHTAVFNEGGGNIDFRIESMDQTSMFNLDASHNSIGIRMDPYHGLDLMGFGCPTGPFQIYDYVQHTDQTMSIAHSYVKIHEGPGSEVYYIRAWVSTT